MKKFIIGFGSFLKNDYIMYSLFKWIMLNLNLVFNIVLLILNVLVYVFYCNIEWVCILNILLSIFIIINIICHIMAYDENRDYPYYEKDKYFMFKTDKYKKYFKKIEQ